MNYYILDLQSMTPTKASGEMYWKWHKELDEHKKTKLGLRIEKTLTQDACISTVFLGRSTGVGQDGVLLFETLVAGGKYNKWLRRYATYSACLKGHDEVARRIKNDEHVASLDKAMGDSIASEI